MNFNVVDGVVVNFEDIYDDFVQDYIFSTALKNKEIRKKYGLSHSEFKELADIAKAEHGLTRRPIVITGAKYYYKHKRGYAISKAMGGCVEYIGFVATEALAIKAVEMCKNASWDIAVCKKIVRELSEAHV